MDIFLITLLTIAASFIATVSGFGASTIMIPILAFFLPPLEVIFLVAIIHWFGDVWKLVLFRSGLKLKLVVLFGIPGIVFSYVGASVALGIDRTILLQLLGVFFVAYAGFLFLKPSFNVTAKSGTAVIGGGLSGFFAGLFGVGGAVRGVFLSAFDLPKAVYLATTGAVGLVIDSVRITAYIGGGTRLPPSLQWGLVFFIPASLIGAVLAKKMVKKIAQHQFRMVIAFFLLAVGLKFILFP